MVGVGALIGGAFGSGHGSGTGVLNQSPSVEERTEKINNAVTQILEQFPPNKAK